MDLHLIPAYGRDYKSKKAVLADWEAGKDFKMVPRGSYVSKRDLSEKTGCVTFRYQKLTKVFVVYPE